MKRIWQYIKVIAICIIVAEMISGIIDVNRMFPQAENVIYQKQDKIALGTVVCSYTGMECFTPEEFAKKYQTEGKLTLDEEGYIVVSFQAEEETEPEEVYNALYMTEILGGVNYGNASLMMETNYVNESAGKSEVKLVYGLDENLQKINQKQWKLMLGSYPKKIMIQL